MINDVASDSFSDLLPIGECRTQLTAKALRIYDEIGLLRTVDVDQSNGHRRYGVEQVRTARLIGIIGIRSEPGHDEAFTTITKAQWAYPAILAAYDAVGCSPEATARPRSPLSCQEVYVAEPETIDDDELICDIAYPLG